MKIIKKRIRTLENNLPRSLFGKVFIPAIIFDISTDREKIISLGFSERMEVGETILPAAVGSVSLFNSEGREIPDKTKPKETRYREIEWCWKQWAGYRQTETVCDFRLVPYKRWQRVVVDPPSVELSISKKVGNKIFISAPATSFSDETEKDAVHKINLLLELCGSCEILDDNQIPIMKVTKSLNWNILPQGKRPWIEQKKLLKPLLDLITDKRANPVIQSRFEDINRLNPEFTAIGNQGFNGYIVFGFPEKSTYVFESAFYGNAIYVFNEDWESLSKKTKAEILNAKLQIDRITHNGERANWLKRLGEILK